MKKGLLGLLVVALTIVGCQNYDDQFDDLNSKISSLATTVDGLLSVQTTVSALSTKLDNLASTALTDSDLAGILTEVAAVKQSVADLSLADDLAGIETEVADLDAEVDQILEKLNELLTANAVINQNVRITSLAELALAEDLIKTGEDNPNVTINGSLVVNTTGSSDITLAADIAKLNAVLNKIKVVMKTVTVTTDEALTATALQYIQGDLGISATTGTLGAGALTTVTGAMTINQGGDLLMPTLNSVAGGITIDTSNVTVTSVDFSGLTEGAARTTPNNLALPDATSVKISGVLPTTVNCPKATTFVSNSTAAQTTTTITIDGSTDFSLGSASFSGAVVITATGAVNLAGVTSAKALTITSGGAVNLGGLTKIESSAAISATTVDIGGVTEISSSTVVTATDVTLTGLTTGKASITLVGPTSVSVPALATLSSHGIVAADATTFAAPALTTSTGTIDIGSGATVHLKNLSTITGTLLDIATVQNLKLVEQDSSIDFATAVHLVTLDYTGKKQATPSPGTQANALTITSANASLTTLSIGSDGAIGTLTVSGSTLTTLNTAGIILNTVVKGNSALTTFDFQHTHVNGENATTVAITDNPKITDVNLGSLAKVKTITITGNASLTTIAAPSASVLAEPITIITFTIQNNDTKGTYTKAVAGSETDPYVAATLTGETVTGFKGVIDAYVAAGNTTVTYSIEIDEADLAGDAAAQAAGPDQQLTNNNNFIDSAKELLLLTD